MKALKTIGLVTGGVVLALFGLVLALPLLISSEWLRPRVEEAVETALKRDVALNGPIKLSAFPQVKATISDVEIANAPGFSAPYLIKAQSLTAAVKLFPLLGGQVEITKAELTGADLRLQQNTDGANNWTFAESLADPGEPAPLPNIQAKLALRDSRIVYQLDNSPALTFERINADLTLQRALTASLSMALDSAPITFEAQIADWRAMLAGEVQELDAAIGWADFSTKIAGTMQLGEKVLVNLAVEGNAPSARAVAASGNVVVPDGFVDGPIAVTGQIESDGSLSQLRDFQAKIANLAANGGIVFDTRGEKPALSGEVAFAPISLDDFGFGAAPAGASETKPAPKQDAAAPAQDETIPSSTEAAPIDLAFLRDYSVDLALRFAQIRAAGAEIGNVALTAKAGDGKGEIRLSEAQAFGGRISGFAQAIAGDLPQFSGDLTAKDVRLDQLSAFAPDLPALAGLANVALVARGAGADTESLAANLAISGTARLANGSVEGVDLKEILAGKAPTGAIPALSGLEANAVFQGLDRPLSIDGRFVAGGEAFAVKGSVAAPQRLLLGARPSAAQIQAKSRMIDAAFSGSVRLAPELETDGEIELGSEALRDLMRFAGTDLGDGDGFQAFRVSGKASLTPKRIAFDDAVLRFDAIAGRGNVVLDMAGAVPKVTGALDLDRLDVTPYLPPPAPTTLAPWSEEKLDFAALKAFDVDFDISAAGMKANDIQIGRSTLKVSGSGGKLRAELREMALYGGTGSGVVSLDGSGAEPKVAVTTELKAINALPLLTDAAKFKLVDGKGTIRLDVASLGDSQAAIMRNLAGTSAFSFEDGAIVGVNLAQVMRSALTVISSGGNFDRASLSTQQTDFSAFTGSFAIDRGIARTEDLQLIGPLVRMSGKGSVDFGGQKVDLAVQPRLVASLQGQGGNANQLGLQVPLRLTGPFTKVGIGVDQALVTDALRATALESARGGLAALFGSALGGRVGPADGSASANSGDAAPAPSVGDTARGALGSALGRVFRGGEAPAPAAPPGGTSPGGTTGNADAGAAGQPPAPAPTQPQTPPPTLRDLGRQALGGLFGTRPTTPPPTTPPPTTPPAQEPPKDPPPP